MERPLKHPSYAPRLVRRYCEGISRQTHAHRAAGSPHFITKKTIHHAQKPVPCMRQTCMLEFIRTGVADAPRRSPRPCLNCNCNCTASPESPLPIHTCPRLPIYNAPFIPSVSSRHARYWIPPSTPRDHHHQPIQNGLHACIRGSESKKRKGKKIRRTEDMTTPSSSLCRGGEWWAAVSARSIESNRSKPQLVRAVVVAVVGVFCFHQQNK